MNKSEVQLSRFIEERLTPGADVSDIDRRIRSHFEEEWAVVFTDMAGLSRVRPAETIIHYLCLVHEMKRITRPLIESSGGIIVKSITDSYLAIFKRPHDALSALLQINRRLATYNAEREEEQRIEIGAGLGFGKILKVGQEDVFGLEVNGAVRLGAEALAYDVLMTDSARAALLHTPGIGFEERPATRSFRATYDLRDAPNRSA
jgi:adenylate cyclase